MTEGTCEKALLDILLSRNMLIYNYDDLLYQQIFHARQINNQLLEMINQLPVGESLSIVRVGDKLDDTLDLTEIELLVKESLKVCIKPEFEILHILNENLFKEFMKVKSKKKACDFYSEKNAEYKKSYVVNKQYFDKLNDEELISLIKLYDIKRKGAHGSEEKTLLFLIKESLNG